MPLPATRAVVRVLPIVHHNLVFFHVAKSREPHPARGACVRPLPRVGTQVCVKMAFPSESPPALRTRERGAISGVHVPPVLSQVRGLGEALAADIAHVEPLLGMHCPVVSP